MSKMQLENKLEITLQVLFLLWCIIIPLSTAGMQIFLGLVIGASILLSIIRRKSPVLYHPIYIFIAAYVLSDLISAFNSGNWSESLNAVFSNDWIIIAVPFLISLPINSLWRKRSFKALIITATIAGIYGVVQFFTGQDYIRGGTLALQGNFFRAIGTYSGYYTYGGNQLFAFAAAYAFFILTKKWTLEKKQYLLFSALIFLSIIASFTRSTWLGGIFVLLLGAFVLDKKKFIYTLGGLALIGFLLFLVLPDLQDRFLSIFIKSKNEVRLTLWKTSWEIFKDYPLFGIGQGNFPKFFLIYKVPGYFDAHSHAHNDFINITVSNGLFGLMTWLAMWGSWFYYVLKDFVNKISEEPDRQILLASVLGISGILVAAFFQCFFTDLENNIFWWFLATTALQIVLKSKEKTKIETS